uniref:DDE_Tnp_1_7 domain-containing protein n=1 Tax=Glossina pallidipes TaxID=7398 RepID=A0A1A9ZIB6_GLOPL
MLLILFGLFAYGKNWEEMRISIGNRSSGKLKPDAIFDYNNAKKGVDISDQIASYYNSLRKTIKWYPKMIIELLCVTSNANAWYIHQKWGSKHFGGLQFGENIIDRLLDEMPTEPLNLKPKRGTAHFLQKYPRTARQSRKRCRECYKNLSARRGRAIASKKSKRVTTLCRFCEDNNNETLNFPLDETTQQQDQTRPDQTRPNRKQ